MERTTAVWDAIGNGCSSSKSTRRGKTKTLPSAGNIPLYATFWFLSKKLEFVLSCHHAHYKYVLGDIWRGVGPTSWGYKHITGGAWWKRTAPRPNGKSKPAIDKRWRWRIEIAQLTHMIIIDV